MSVPNILVVAAIDYEKGGIASNSLGPGLYSKKFSAGARALDFNQAHLLKHMRCWFLMALLRIPFLRIEPIFGLLHFFLI